MLESGRAIQSQKFTVPANAILFSKLNPRIPRVWEPNVSAELPAVASTEFLVPVPRPGVDRRHLKYACLAPSVLSKMEERVGGTSGSHQRVRPHDVLSIQLEVLPTLGEQKAIAHTLGTLDDKIELNRRMNETLEAMAQALFKSWFVDFDPVHAKAEGRDTGLPPDIAALFPDSFEESELGEIRKGWKAMSLPCVVEVNPVRRQHQGDLAPYLDMANMPTQGHSPNAVSDRPFSSGMRFMNGDSLVARITPCLENGKTAYVDFLQDNQIGWGSTEYIILRPSPLRRPFVTPLSMLLHAKGLLGEGGGPCIVQEVDSRRGFLRVKRSATVLP